MYLFPIGDVVHRNLVIGIALRPFAHINYDERRNQSLRWNLVHGPFSLREMSRCIQMGAEVLGQANFPREIVIFFDSSYRFRAKERFRRFVIGRVCIAEGVGQVNHRPETEPLGLARVLLYERQRSHKRVNDAQCDFAHVAPEEITPECYLDAAFDSNLANGLA